jgi:hypothetical protein
MIRHLLMMAPCLEILIRIFVIFVLTTVCKFIGSYLVVMLQTIYVNIYKGCCVFEACVSHLITKLSCSI